MATDILVKEKYDETFESVYHYLKMKQDDDPKVEIMHLERFLEDLYIYEGNDWLGRGELKDASIAATISACQVLIEELRAKEGHK